MPKLAIYLFKDEVKSLNGAIRADAKGYREVEPSEPVPYPARLFVREPAPKVPKWSEFYESHYEVGEFGLQAATGAVLVVEVDGRVFAVTNGVGHTAIDRSHVEPRFGLKVALNTLDRKGIKSVDTRTIDTKTQNRKTEFNSGSELNEFGMNPTMDWVRAVKGRPASRDFARALSGADPAAITCECDLDSLPEKLRELLEAYASDAYKAEYGFIDYTQSLDRRDPRIPKLNALRDAMFQSRQQQRIALALPEIEDEKIDRYHLFYRKESFELSELSLHKVYQHLEAAGLGLAVPENIRVAGYDDSGSPVTDSRSLRDFIVCEVDLGTDLFVFSLGGWFQLDRDHVERLKNEVRAIPNLTATLNFPPMIAGEHEGPYNDRVAAGKAWIKLDKEFFRTGSYDKIEIADHLTPNNEFIAVKRMTSSATLSHLFSQASVSAQLLRGNVQYREKVVELGSKATLDYQIDSPRPTFVYAIATEKDGDLVDSLFFFSLVNLADRAQVIRNVGYDVALCRIEIAPKV